MSMVMLPSKESRCVDAAWTFESIPAKRTFRRSTMTYENHVVDVKRERSSSVPSVPRGSSTTRRNVFRHSIACILPSSIVLGQNQIAMAAEHRQLELCLVAVLRVLYWAQYELQHIDAVLTTDPDHHNNNDIIDRQRAIYLETRLGAKAALTGRITGSGATNRVYILTTLQLPGCLQDLEWYLINASPQNRKNGWFIGGDVCTSFREGLASIVEFDGLDALNDPSPRSALTISQYNIDKLKLVRRTLNERIIPDGQKLAVAFGSEAYERSYGYVQQYHSAEIPVRPPFENVKEG